MAEDYPQTMLDLERRFADEASCRTYLAAMRWPDGFVCPDCQARRSITTGRGRLRCTACSREVTVTSGTVLQDSKLPLRLWVRAIWHVTNQKNGMSALGLQRALGLGSYKTAWTVLHKLRTAMVRLGRERLTGEVEVDETFVGGVRRGARGRGAAGKVLVLMAVEVRSTKIGRAPANHSRRDGGHTARFCGGTRRARQRGRHGRPRQLWFAAQPRLQPYRLPVEHRTCRRLPTAQGASRRVASETMVACHAPGRRQTGTPASVPRRVHFSLQSPHLRIPRKTILPACATDRATRPADLSRHQKPQPVVVSGVT